MFVFHLQHVGPSLATAFVVGETENDAATSARRFIEKFASPHLLAKIHERDDRAFIDAFHASNDTSLFWSGAVGDVTFNDHLSTLAVATVTSNPVLPGSIDAPSDTSKSIADELLGRYTVSYRLYGSVEVRASSPKDAEERFDNIDITVLVDGLGSDGDDAEFTEATEDDAPRTIEHVRAAVVEDRYALATSGGSNRNSDDVRDLVEADVKTMSPIALIAFAKCARPLGDE